MPDNTLPPGMELALTSLKKADQDLVAVGKWLHDLDISDEIIGFHIQQCIEKSLLPWIVMLPIIWVCFI